MTTRASEKCRACGYPVDEHGAGDRDICASVIRDLDEEDARRAVAAERNDDLWRLARSVGK